MEFFPPRASVLMLILGTKKLLLTALKQWQEFELL